MVTLKLHSDAWSNERPVSPFLKNVSPRQVGPDGALLLFSVTFMKPGKGKAFLVSEWKLVLQTKVRSLVVARWVLDRVSEVSELREAGGSGKEMDEIGLALLIESATKLLSKGPESDPPPDEGEGETGVGARLRPRPRPQSGRARGDADDPVVEGD